jgi:hypothetical protein
MYIVFCTFYLLAIELCFIYDIYREINFRFLDLKFSHILNFFCGPGHSSM